MSFFRKIGNGLARFMYGRNGADQLSLAMVWTGLILDIVGAFIKNDLINAILAAVSGVLLLLALLRIFSRNLQKRRAENAKFLEKVWWPLKRKFGQAKQQAQDKDHKYFTCPNCAAVCRVPRGKGKIVITCPRCRTKIQGKT